jgi:uncharacterized protein (TIGR03437 family)
MTAMGIGPARRYAILLAMAALAAGNLAAAGDRVAGSVDPSRSVALKGHVHPRAQIQNDRGAVDPGTALNQVTLMLKPDASLEPFLTEQQNPSSGNYHRWLTPAEFGDRFGLSRDDIAKVVSWLTAQGLTVNQVAQGRHWITFGGTAGSIGRALGTQIRRYQVDGQPHFANASEPRIPAALEPVVAGFDGLDDFSPQPLYIKARITPDFNLAGGANFLVPDDIAAIYNINPLYQAGIDGTGQKIVIVGVSALDLTDIRAFRQIYNLPAKDPKTILVGTDPGINSALVESDLDLEWAGAVARNADLIYVYAQNVFSAAQYAIDQNLAPVMSMSFGGCEVLSSVGMRAIAQQANAQGITWVASSGDTGAVQCDRGSLTQEASKGPTVSAPASYPEVTAVGGTTLNEGTGTYWKISNSATGGSALSYIPEVPWNDAAQDGALVASGGGASANFAKPLWQTGPGVPNDNARDVPDIAFAASPNHDGYLIMTSGEIDAVGGTSASAPVFAGMLGLLNQQLVSKGAQSLPGLGNINPVLYRMAQSTTDVFHDVTAGDIKVPCAQGSPACTNGVLGYSAGQGYDLATGLGSADAFHLVTEWSIGKSSSTTVTASAATLSVGDTVTLTATVTAASGATPAAGSASPSGSVDFVVNDVNIGTGSLAASGSGAAASLSTTALALAGGNGTVNALYGGDSVFASSAGSANVPIKYPATGSFIVVTINPTPTPQSGPVWPFTITLSERAGVATTLTGFSEDGQNLPVASFFATTKIPANGSISTSVVDNGFVAPSSAVFKFTGVDANGQTWSQQVTVNFTAPAGGAPVLAPGLTLTGTPSTVQQNPQADPSCQWVQQVILQETGGFLMQLTRLTLDTTDVTGQIQQLFGTTRIAPYGILQGNICFPGPTAPTFKNYLLTGSSPELGITVVARLPVTFGPAAASAATLSVSTQAIQLALPSPASSPSATLGLNFGGASAAWTVAVSPANLLSSWLRVSPRSGTGTAQLTVQASGTGLSPGVYTAILNIQAANAIPQAIDVPVTLIVGASGAIGITAIANAGSFQNAAAPGMLMTVFGTQLAPAPAQASGGVLPLSLNGVSATVNGITAPVVAIAPTQITVQVPYETGLGTAVLGVNNHGQVAAFSFPVGIAAPGILGFAIDPFSGAFVPSAKAGSPLALEITGDGDVNPFLPTGATPASGTTAARLPKPRLPVTVTIGGVAAAISFVGIPPGAIGITELDITVPAKAPVGLQPVVVTVGGVASPPLTLIVTP